VRLCLAAVAAALACAPVSAQVEDAGSPGEAQAAALSDIEGQPQETPVQLPEPDAGQAPEPEPEQASITIPRLTEVVVAVMADLSSNESQRGQTFPIRLIQPIVIDGVEVVPAGAEGEGEVVHAKGSGGMGAAGELLLTARYILHNGQRIDLRSFRMGAEANSRIDTVNAINVASTAALPLVGLVGFFIEGDALRVATGTPALAKLSADVVVPLPSAEASPVVFVDQPAEEAPGMAEIPAAPLDST
jgi:hypothetical protein